MEGLRQHRTFVAWIAILALLGNVAAGLFCSVSHKRDGLGYPPELLALMVICTEHGERALADDGVAGGLPDAPAKPCALCLAAAGLTLILALAALLAFVPVAGIRRIASTFAVPFADGLRRNGLGSRAPPLPA
jgi:hypothetical protein